MQIDSICTERLVPESLVHSNPSSDIIKSQENVKNNVTFECEKSETNQNPYLLLEKPEHLNNHDKSFTLQASNEHTHCVHNSITSSTSSPSGPNSTSQTVRTRSREERRSPRGANQLAKGIIHRIREPL